MFESRISAGAIEKLPCSGKLGANISSLSCDMEGHAKKCVERYCELANKTTQLLYKVATSCIDDHEFKEEEMGSVEELSKVCSHIVLKCLYLVDLIFLWSVNKLARELANKRTQQLYKVSTPCIDDHHFKEEELKSVGEMSKVCSQIVLKCLYLARIGRPDILWSVNKLARSITKWTSVCDKRLARLISCISSHM